MYTIGEYNISTIIENGFGQIPVKVEGYWSRDSISIYCSCDSFRDYKWRVEVNHSTGGRDQDEVEDDLKATVNFANAMLAAAELAEDIRSKLQSIKEAA